MTFREDGAAALEWAARYLEQVGDFPVLAQVEPGDIRSRLPAAPPEQGEPFADVLRDLDEILLPGTTHWQSPRFFAYFAASAAEPGILAELLAATLNSVGFIWRTSPASTELEAHTLDWTAQLLGLPAGWHGHIEDSASVSTIAALAAAREANGGRVVVCSEEAHSSVERAARLLGLETRKVPLDAEFRLDAGALDLTDATALVATVGTTSTAAVDPVPLLADACEAAGVWLHVDAAYAGSSWVCPELRWSQAGVERADSLVVNAHKWLGAAFDCTLYYVRDPEHLVRVMSTTPSYLQSAADGRVKNLRDWGIPLGRRFRALKLWFLIREQGVSGLQARLRRDLENARWLADEIRGAAGWQLLAPVPLQTLCVRHEPAGLSGEALDRHTQAWADRVNRSGAAYLTPAVLDGRWMVRVSIGAEQTERPHVEALWKTMQTEAAR